ncbi:MarR family transcriptional regulator [Paenibacillus sp.]|uniref:MarR family winged helix-turn-helix transcriptional regulator n=1 Tax=Paenibacillus sp. TaxID=58172 RepID=UPI0028AD363C|nr:MarR family transcriptional regulator [Paenibacillus sp.]
MSTEQDKQYAIHKVMESMANVQQKSQFFIDMITKQETLTHNQILLLFQLRLTGSLNITDISERFVITPGAASSMCDKMEEAGLIERVRTKEDRRVVNIVLTEQGDRRILHIFEAFPTSDLDKISETLEQINELMDKMMN